MFPEPRITDAKVFMSQTPIDPVNATFEYAIACASASSRPPSAAYTAGPKASISTVYSAPADNPIHIACTASAFARAPSPAPSARLTADDTPPPIAPPDSISCSITIGNTSAIPASEATPSRPT